MKKLRAFLCLITIVIISFSNSSCNFSYVNETSIAKEASEEIIRCFDEKDAESLKTMFFANDLPTNNLDKQIKEAFELYKGPSVTYNIPNGLGGGKSVRDGEVTYWDVRPTIRDIETDSGIIYNIGGVKYIVYNGVEVNKISYIVIYDQNNKDEKIFIGQIF